MDSLSKVASDVQNHGQWLGHVGSVEKALSMAAGMGRVTHDPRHPDNVRRISPQSLELANPNTLSSRYGLGAFPYHTDVAHWRRPATLVFLYCENPGRASRPSLVMDSRTWDVSEHERQVLVQGVWRVAFLRPFLATIAAANLNGLLLRFDPGCMRPYGRRALAAQEVVTARLASCPAAQVFWRPGDLLILDNSRMLHTRGEARIADTDRVLCRILVGGHP